MNRRHLLTLLNGLGCAAALPRLVHGAESSADGELLQFTKFPPKDRHMRPMNVRRVPKLGLEIWTESEPEWLTELVPGEDGGPPIFTAEAPDNYHPPAVLTITAWRRERVPQNLFQTLADTAIRTAGEGYGLNKGSARAIGVEPKTWGILHGYQGSFSGRAQGTTVDVTLFVGQQEGKYPVVAQIYTQAGKMQHLQEVMRRCWSNITYL